MTSTLPRPLLKLFGPRPPLEYLPPVARLKRDIKIGCIYPYLQNIEPMENMVVDEKEDYVTRIQREYDQRNSKIKLKTSNAYATLFIGRLPKDANEQSLLEIANDFGDTVGIKLILGKRSRYAFIEYKSEHNVRQALRGFPRNYKNKRIVVDVEKARTYKQFIPNRYKVLKKDYNK
eukprot:NODE_25_length_35605_cov_0.353461.p14 type:complete len:176 gc:universal NODE_25_length_35605_cov_0.353461:10796-11323(+)